MSTVTDIIRVDYGNSTLPESMIFDGGSVEKQIPIVFSVFLIKTESKLILVDSGCETMPGMTMSNFIGPVARLKELGYSPLDITDVIITHAHHDHIECVNYFKNAIIHIQENEFESGKYYIPDGFNMNVFKDQFVVDDNVRVIKVGGHTKGSCIVECLKDNHNYVLCGDECYSFYNLRHRIPTANPYSKESAKHFVDKYGDVNKYICLLCHDK